MADDAMSYITRLTGAGEGESESGGVGAASAPEPRVVRVGDADADEVLDALRSDTARAVMAALYEAPAAPATLAERTDTTVQNITYHLDSLREAGLVEPVDSRYSEKGREVTVYGPASDPIVLLGDDEAAERRLSDLLPAVGALALASLAVQAVVDRLLGGLPDAVAVVGPAGRGGTSPGGTLVRAALSAVEPGLLFFCGGLAVVVAVAIRRRRAG
jgi:DNA-binding transcriptional ArsR family regulator